MNKLEGDKREETLYQSYLKMTDVLYELFYSGAIDTKEHTRIHEEIKKMYLQIKLTREWKVFSKRVKNENKNNQSK